VTTILQFLIESIPIFIAIAVPGFLVALALLKKTKLSLFEIFVIGIPIGMSAPAVLAFAEFLVGIPFSSLMAFINLIIITGIGIILLINERINLGNGLKRISAVKSNVLLGYIILVIIMFLAFWVRIQALTPYFMNFDPYWYNSLTQFILTEGGVPVQDTLAWWPNIDSHRNLAHVQYMSAGWYAIFSIFNGVNGFNFETMTLISSLYPPIVTALLCFFA
jgi:hypothetical protein